MMDSRDMGMLLAYLLGLLLPGCAQCVPVNPLRSVDVSMCNLLVALLSVLVFIPGHAKGRDAVDSVPSESRVIEGTVRDSVTDVPLSHATVRVAGTAVATITNYDGRFRLVVPSGQVQLSVTYIGYYSSLCLAPPADSGAAIDIRLAPTALEQDTLTVYGRAYDPAQKIIRQAIRRRQEILPQIHDYACKAYSRVTIQNGTVPDSESVMGIFETQTSAFWEYPNRYKEIIHARRQTTNIEADENLLALGGLEDFTGDRIVLGEMRVPSPTGADALDHYNYYLIDSAYIDDRTVFTLEIEPRNEEAPRFRGKVYIADSSFDVVRLEVRPSRGLSLPLITDLFYYQHMASFAGQYWLPVEIGATGTVKLKVPLPGVPSAIAFQYMTALSGYEVDLGIPPGIFDEYQLVVEKDADTYDSTAWERGQRIPLTALEEMGYARIDSLEHSPRRQVKRALQGVALTALVLAAGGSVLPPQLFHFNRVESAYLGIGGDGQLGSGSLDLHAAAGYAFGPRQVLYNLGAALRLAERRKLWLGFDYKNEVTHRPTFITPDDYNATGMALAWRLDPFDYYRERGASVWVSAKLFDRTRVKLALTDNLQKSMRVATRFSLFARDGEPRANPRINEGTLRSLAATFTYDSRPRVLNKGKEQILPGEDDYTRLTLSAEHAPHDVLASDFAFRRLALELDRHQRTPDGGALFVRVFAGTSWGDLPAQRHFTVDFGHGLLYPTLGFNTLSEENYTGSRALALMINHGFSRTLLRQSGIPVLKWIPFSLSLHGGAFWSNMPAARRTAEDAGMRMAPTAYTETGFGLANLTPFLSPFNLAAWFTWQLSDYDTSRFSFQFGLKL